MAADRWSITAIRYATRPTSRADVFYRYGEYHEPDGPQEMAYFFWLLQSPEQTILVDSGFSEQGGGRRNREYLVRPMDALATLGVAPSDIDLLVVTHLHYDHTGHLDRFGDVPMVVPRTELETWTDPVARRAHYAAHIEPDEVEVVAARVRAGTARLIEGSTEIAPGVLAVEVGGHSPGQLILRVQTESGPVVLASDAAHFYEEVDADRACGVLVDLEKVYRAYDTMREMLGEPGARLMPGHDPLVMERFTAAEGDAGAFAVTI